MVEVNGRPFIDWKIEELVRYGVERIVVLTGFRAETLHHHVGQRWGHGAVTVECIAEAQPLGTGGAIAAAVRELPEAFWLTYGDTLLDAPIAPIITAWDDPRHEVLMSVIENCDRVLPSNTTIDGNLVSAYSKSVAPGTHRYLDYGLLVVRSSVFAGGDYGAMFDLSVVLQDLISRSELGAVVVDGWFHDIGTPEALAATDEWLRTVRG